MRNSGLQECKGVTCRSFRGGLYPSLVLWSSQGLKDGPIVFLLALAILCTLKLGEKLSLKYVAVLAFALLGLVALEVLRVLHDL